MHACIYGMHAFQGRGFGFEINGVGTVFITEGDNVGTEGVSS